MGKKKAKSTPRPLSAQRRREPASRESVVSWAWYISQMVLVGLLIGFISWGWLILRDSNSFAFQKVDVYSDYQHVQPTVVRRVVQENLNGGFFSLNTKALEASLLSIPWVATVEVHRKWPGTLRIKIIEQQAIARWDDAELVNKQDQLFQVDPKTMPKDLPELTGPVDSVSVVINMYNYMNNQLQPYNLKIENLDLSQRMAWQLVLDSGANIMLGNIDVKQRFERFLALYPKIVGNHADQLASVDLRYPNGFAIRWKHKRP